MLKYVTDTVPEGLENYYTKTETGYRLNVEGVAPVDEVEGLKNKLKEFRDNNIKLAKEHEKYKNFSSILGGDVDPDALQTKLDRLAQDRANELVNNMKSNYEQKINELSEGLSKRDQQLHKLVLGREVTGVAAKHGVFPTALDDVQRRAAEAFEVVDGELKFKGKSLDAEGKPYTVDTWMQELARNAPHLFATNRGTGTQKPYNGVGSAQQTGLKPGGNLSKIAAGLSTQGGVIKPLAN